MTNFFPLSLKSPVTFEIESTSTFCVWTATAKGHNFDYGPDLLPFTFYKDLFILDASSIVKRSNYAQGIGFVAKADKSKVFVHYTFIPYGGYKSLREDDRICFNIIQAGNARQADRVTRADHLHANHDTFTNKRYVTSSEGAGAFVLCALRDPSAIASPKQE